MTNNAKNTPDVLDILGAIEAPQNLTQSLEKTELLKNNPVEKIMPENIIAESVIQETPTKSNNPEDVLEKITLESTQKEKLVEVAREEKITLETTTEELKSTIKKDSSTNHVSKTTQKEQIKKSTSNQNRQSLGRLLSAGVFGAKYVITSVFIFSVLLLTTNYSAYTNIAKSYIFEDQIALESQSLLNGVDAGYIEEEVIAEEIEEVVVKKTKQDRVEELKKQEEETEQIQNQFSIKKLVDKLDKEDVNLDIDIVPYENRIVIPKIGKNIPLIDIKETTVEGKDQLDNIFMKELEEGIVRYPGSALPGEQGNSFIFGHSSNFPWIAGDYNDVFSRLGQVEVGDIVYSYYGQKKYKYKIKEKKVISPTDVSILKRDEGKSELTLMTCWPIGTTLNRLILVGEIIEE